MNFTKLIMWSLAAVSMWGAGRQVDVIHFAVLKAQAKLIYESRTKNWGSPKFFKYRDKSVSRN